MGITLHITLSHLEHKKSYVRMVVIDFRSAVNTIIPDNMIGRLADLGLPTHTCHWIKDFLFNRPQSVKRGSSTSRTPSIGFPQGCVFSKMLDILYTSDCISIHPGNTIVKFADDMTVVGLITRGNESGHHRHHHHHAARDLLPLYHQQHSCVPHQQCGSSPAWRQNIRSFTEQ